MARNPARPAVSILLPARNTAGTLPACLASIRRQSLGSWECVIVDDGSTDDTPGIVRKIARADGRFRLLSRPQRGLVPALNDGLDHCRGGLIARMDADDLMHRRRLQEQRGLLAEKPDLCAVGCHVRLFPRPDPGRGDHQYEAWLNGIHTPERVAREAFIECPIAHPTLMIRREALIRLGYRDEGWPEDYDLILRLLLTGERIGVLSRRRLLWRQGNDRLSRTAETYSDRSFTECKADFLVRSFLSGTDRYILWGYGNSGRTLASALNRRGKRPSHIIEIHPGRLGNTIRGAPVVPPTELERLPRHPLIVSVARQLPRTRIREALTRLGLKETSDYICAA